MNKDTGEAKYPGSLVITNMMTITNSLTVNSFSEEAYTIITDTALIEGAKRISELFHFGLTTGIAKQGVTQLESNILQTLKQKYFGMIMFVILVTEVISFMLKMYVKYSSDSR